ncbi:holo-ACP synthase [Bowmanella yangjiangensis]|uniref:Holo-[acyl-carrier-protein] synthase n=1 Tax=Bowmanella yangjiangensis TaxID=2811230 RepID=A0ABS3CMN6_9ALTE|nr:holo-ACP synthase [Bowmanella yangjiangensis]MBN7818367.1 holo-ACP synthase [Bowmanella yangjiangensis]
MAIVGMGTDIVEIKRIGDALAKSQRLAERVLTDAELEDYKQHNYPERFLAKRFAAKEAMVKAIGTGIGNGISFRQMEIGHHASGAPFLLLSGNLQVLCDEKGVSATHLSIADEQHYAVATVILEK